MTRRCAGNLSRNTILICGLIALAAATASAQHPAIYLLDHNGDMIDPINGENANAPFSTKQTCGMCHDYDVITEGYHFQMGWDTVSDDFGVEEGRPWSLSNGFLGRWYPYAYRQLAKKDNAHADEIDLTVYDFVGFSSPGRGEPPCGACHPGGGGLEFDRDGKRYDEHLGEDPELADTLDGDYYQSRWDRSGVVEADCLICHLEGYDFEQRVEQLENGNYRWAVVAGSRLGIVDGAVRRGHEPTVKYEKRLFNVDGTITLDMSWPPPDDNCVYCHGRSDVKKRGFSWNDIFNPDVHNQQGISCTACHPAGLDHQIAKGDEPAFTAAPEFDGTILTCQECHMSGYLGAPVPEHASIRPGHIESIACESCHIPQLNRAAAHGHEATTGRLDFISRPPDATEPGEGLLEPDYERRSDGHDLPDQPLPGRVVGKPGRGRPGLPALPARAGGRVAGLRGRGRGRRRGRPQGGQPATRRSSPACAPSPSPSRATSASSRSNRSTSRRRSPTSSMRTATWSRARSRARPSRGASYVNFSINHNTAPTRMALGVNGCKDCHVERAHFFRGQRIRSTCTAPTARR